MTIIKNDPMVRVFHVRADADTGEWIGEPVDTGMTEFLGTWALFNDNSGVHFDTWERPINNDNPQDTETVAIAHISTKTDADDETLTRVMIKAMINGMTLS